jgi:uncharacterized protein (TIGR02145 family)
MKKLYFFLTSSLLLLVSGLFAQGTVTDYEGHVYHTVSIGDQLWLKENLRSRYYTDGVPIFGVEAYDQSDSLANLYGLLYSWDAAMRNDKNPSTQGACPNGWHVPLEEEFSDLDVALGGPNNAGGKMKSTATGHWADPNSGATNSSGFSAFPAGEFDAIFTNKFQFLHYYAFFWTSTESGSTEAIERWLSYDNAASSSSPISKLMKNSVRCVKNPSTGINPVDKDYGIRVNNPVSDKMIIQGESHLRIHNVELIDITGQLIYKTSECQLPLTINVNDFTNGLYFLRIQIDNQVIVKKISKTN